MKILVLGSEGQIGKPFCEFSIIQGNRIVRWDKKLKPEMDLTNKKNLDELYYLATTCDKIVFLAYEVGGSKYLKDKDKSYQFISDNIKIMSNTFDLLAYAAKPILFASSQMSNMYHTNYGLLKQVGERYTKALKQSFCRFWNVYGYEDPQDTKSHVITDLVNSALTKGVVKTLTNGQEVRQFLHVNDCSRALHAWCHDGIPLKEFDVTSFEWHSIAEIAGIIGKLLDVPVELGSKSDPMNQFKNEPNTEVLSYWKPSIKLEEGISKIIYAQKAET